MLTDAHCHPSDLLALFPGAEGERRLIGCPCAASAWNREQFERHEALAREAAAAGGPPLLLCFAVHPQLPASGDVPARRITGDLLPLLETLAAGGRLDVVGEAGFDLYSRAFRDTEAAQEEIFRAHLETALGRGLPLLLHLRRAMHKAFAYTASLKKLPAVIFHSWPGTVDDGKALLRRGINAYFSFGLPVMLNHKAAIRSCALFPPERLLLETDAPYQPLRGRAFSSWADLPALRDAMARLRREAGSPGGSPEELEAITAINFCRAFGKAGPGGSRG